MPSSFFTAVVLGAVGGVRGDLAGVPTELMAPSDLAEHRALGYANEASLVDCDFDTGDECDWDLGAGLQNAWELESGQTPSGDGKSGPSSDKSGSGYYVYTESDKNTGEEFGMRLSLGHAFSAHGISFYYYLRKWKAGELLRECCGVLFLFILKLCVRCLGFV